MAKRACGGKVRYRDELQARTAMRTVAKHSTREKNPKRLYYCTDCKGYHLTSRARWVDV